MSATSVSPDTIAGNPADTIFEIKPKTSLARASVRIPGSKSITNRALLAAAVSTGTVTLKAALWSEDTQVMVEALRTLGFKVDVAGDKDEAANRTIVVEGQGGQIPRGGTADAPLELFVGNAGTATRFLMALCCLGTGVYRLSGVPRMHERPQAGLMDALRQLGYRLDASDGAFLPVTVFGTGARPGARCTVPVSGSSQFASALLLLQAIGQWDVSLDGYAEGIDSARARRELPYVWMTAELVRNFPAQGTFVVEPDASSASYFVGANWALNQRAPGAGSQIEVLDWPSSGWQIDAELPKFLPSENPVSRASDLADAIMTAIALAPLGARATTFTDLGRLRVQECERVAALRDELRKCGVKVDEKGDDLTVFPGGDDMAGAEIETYGDHRVAMCFATLGLVVPGMRIRNPGCVAKTFPNFFAKLASPSPHGLGAEILDGKSGRRLAMSELVF